MSEKLYHETVEFGAAAGVFSAAILHACKNIDIPQEVIVAASLLPPLVIYMHNFLEERQFSPPGSWTVFKVFSVGVTSWAFTCSMTDQIMISISRILSGN
jgi:hypothetical protein